MPFIYRVGIAFLFLFVKIFSLFNLKARKFLKGRQNLFEELKSLEIYKYQPIWIHVASLGEFEQAKPVIDQLKKKDKDIKILLSFFSPSGYEVKKNYSFVDWVCYSPIDTPYNAKKFIELVRPRLIIFVKYEFWYFILKEITFHKIPIIMISCVFRKNQFYFKKYGAFFIPIFKKINHFFVQNQSSAQIIQQYTDHITISGDTRFDRVIEIAKNVKKTEKITSFIEQNKVIILGSLWKSDLKVIKPFIQSKLKNYKFIVAPHNVDKKEISYFQKSLDKHCLYSSKKNISDSRVMIIDNIGMLSSLYQYAHYAIIGGGFRGSLHNTLEAAVFGIPVFFGKHKNNKKFIEASMLLENEAAFEFTNHQQMESFFSKLENNLDYYQKVSDNAKTFVQQHKGSTQQIINKIYELI